MQAGNRQAGKPTEGQAGRQTQSAFGDMMGGHVLHVEMYCPQLLCVVNIR
jgi:hypothetical protein